MALEQSNSKLKKRKRDVERLLKKQDLPSNVRLEKEKELQGLQLQLKNNEVKIKSRKFSKKYHMIKFFEKKKAIRLYKKTKSELTSLQEGSDSKDNKKEIKKLRKKLEHCETDVLYIVNYPKNEKYISLYPKDTEQLTEEEKKGKARTDAKRQELKSRIKTMMQNGTLPVNIDQALEGHIDHKKLEDAVVAKLEEPDKPVKKKVEEDNDDDEFFE